MILDVLFIHLRRGKPGKFFASFVLDFYGRLAVGGPTIDDLPKQAPLEVRQRIVDTWFNHNEDRLPEKRLDKWEVGQLKAAQLRDEEEKFVAKRVFWASAILCTVLYGAGVGIQKSDWKKELDAKWQQHKAQAAAEDAREAAAEREALKKELAAEIAGYSAQKCLDEVSELRDRKSEELSDRYSALEQGCASKRAEIEALAKVWSLDECVDFGLEANKQKAAGGQFTWVDDLVFRNVCYPTYGEALQARLK